ncbi:MAG TPA: alpha/beta hydrolase [Leptolyngbyaceae cyanobacterium]
MSLTQPQRIQPLSLLRCPLGRRGVSSVLSALTIGLGALSILLFPPAHAEALEEVNLTYGNIELETIPVSDLEEFVLTGNPSDEIQSLLDTAGIDKDKAQTVLSRQLEVDGQLLTTLSQTFIGETLLQQVGTAISRPNSQNESWRDLRTALVAAVADDKLSTLEVLQNFEGASITIDAEQVGRVAGDVQRNIRDIQALMEILRSRQSGASR